MPKFLNVWLKSLSDKDAEQLWKWLDETPFVNEYMIEALVESHKKLPFHIDLDVPDEKKV